MSKFRPEFWKRQKHTPNWVRVSDLPDGHVKAIEDRDMWWCHQAQQHPDGSIERCSQPPVAEACRDSGDGQMIRSLFCEEHLRAWCELKGLPAPSLGSTDHTARPPRPKASKKKGAKK